MTDVEATTAAELRAGFADPPLEAAPMVRWWWFGPAVERPELDRELTAMAAAGFGGAEVAYVYPLGPATTTFVSEDFLADVRYAAERARDLGLRFDLTLGSGWSFGGPHVTPDLAARRLHWERREISPPAQDIPIAAAWAGDELVGAYVGAGSQQEAPDAYEPLVLSDGVISVPAGEGPRLVLLAWSRLTGQNVKRAAVGAEGPVLDHYDPAAVDAHLRAVADPLLDAVPAELLGSVFCDSLEVYESDWTHRLPEEFAARCGYDLLPVLYRLAADGTGAAEVRADVHRTLARLYEENFVARFQRWAAGRGVPFRIQSYGTPPATISSYRFADLIEGEGWGWKRLTQTRWASSAGHLYSRRLISAESWTWVHSPSFRATPLDLQGEAHEHFLNGINHLIGHGWPYSPSDAPGLGWFFYAAGALDDRNPWWPVMPALNAHLQRLSWLLRQGEPLADVAVYVPNEDLFATMGNAVGGSLDPWREATRRIDPAVITSVRESGYDYDLVDDEALAVTPPDRYPVVLVPATTRAPAATVAWLGAVVAAGGSVFLLDSGLAVDGAETVALEALAASLAAAQEPEVALDPPDPAVGAVHRRVGDADVYLLANTGPTLVRGRVTLRAARAAFEEWDPDSGRVVRVGAAADGIDVTVHPYQATVLVLTDTADPGRSAARPSDVSPDATTGSTRSAQLTDVQVTFGEEVPAAVTLPHVWEESGHRSFSGVATYTATVELGPLDADDRVVIDFGEPATGEGGSEHHVGMVGPSYRAAAATPVGEVAVVRLNDVACGVLWAPPYRVDLSHAARSGRNSLELRVANTAANAVAVDEHIVRLAAESEHRYGRRFRMQQLDRAMDGVRSGLLAVPVITVGRGPAADGP